MTKKLRHTYIAVRAGLLFALVLVLISSATAQSAATKQETPNAAPQPGTQTVNAQQSGSWNVGIDAARNAVRVSNSADDAVPVKVVSGAAKQPFHTKVPLTIFGGGPSSSTETSITVPAGKRLVIEAISANAEIPAGSRATISILFYAEGTSASWGLHYVSLVDQGTFGTNTVLTANHKTVIYAIGQITLRARPTWTGVNGNSLVDITGYLEDLPTTP